MNNLLFEKKPQTEEEILKLVKDFGFDMKKLQEDANSVETMQEISKEIDEAYKKGINGTPTTMIDNDAHIGIMTYQQFKDWAKRAGAEKR